MKTEIEAKIKYIKGLPTKKFLKELIKKYPGVKLDGYLVPCQLYGRDEFNFITWSNGRKYINDHVPGLLNYFKENGINAELVNLLVNNKPGIITILKKQ